MINNKKTIRIMLTFIFCIGFLAPAFIAPSAAEAVHVANVEQNNNVPAGPDQNLGYFKVEVMVADWTDSGVANSQLLVSYPS